MSVMWGWVMPVVWVALLLLTGILVGRAMKHGTLDIDVRGVYLLSISFLTTVGAFVDWLLLSGIIADLILVPGQHLLTEITFPLSGLVVVLPVGIWHWRAARRNAFAKNTFAPLNFYLNAWMAFALFVALVHSWILFSNLIKFWLESDFGNSFQVQAFWRVPAIALVNLLIALALWQYHRDVAQRLLATARGQEAMQA